MDYKYNEKLYGETIYNDGFQTNYIKSELVILVKYLKQVKGYSKKETEEFLYKFCKKYIEGFNEVIYFKVIDNAIKKGRKKDNKLIVVKKIPILKSELEYIDSLEIEHEYKKLLLAFLVNKKISFEIHRIIDKNAELSTYFEGSNKKYREIFKIANITGKYKIDEMVNELVQKEIVTSIIKGDIVLDYMYSIYDFEEENIEVINKITKEKKNEVRKHIKYEIKKDDIYEEITNFENIGYIFDYYKEENNVKKCEECGDYIKSKNNKTKYCPLCAREIEKENWVKRKRKQREKENVTK